MRKISVFLLFLLLPFFFAQAEELSEKLKGRILLQVESNGEAWYVSTESQKRFYLGRPADAFRVMREQGLGISNKDFDSFAGAAPERLAGKILLKIESNGEAYYVNPLDLKMHYLGRPADAFRVMREQGLGISNIDMEEITIDEGSSPVLSEEETEQAEKIEEVVEEEIIDGADDGSATTTEETIEDANGETATSTEDVIEDAAEEAAATSCVWLAEYFNNKSVFGVPEATSTEEQIVFDWGRGGPDEITKVDSFSIRYTTDCYFEGGRYEFQTKFDDAIRVYLDNENFLQSWTDNNTKKVINRERNVEEGVHEVRVHYYDAIRDASISVDWVKIN